LAIFANCFLQLYAPLYFFTLQRDPKIQAYSERMELIKIKASEDFLIQAYAWKVAKPLAIVQITHGMMEHAGRYDHFARWLNENQIAVYASDHIGHGLSIKSSSDLGHFPNKDDWRNSVDILHKITCKIRAEHPGIPLFLLGHSMGSVVAQTYMIRYGRAADGYMLSGPVRQSKIMATIGHMISVGLSFLFGPSKRSKLLIYLGYGQYNKRIKPRRTAFDWISSVDGIVDEYTSSPLCGFPCSNRFYLNFFRGFNFISEYKNLKQVPPGMPVYIFAGRMDPAGKFGQDPKKINYLLSKFAHAKVLMKLYPKGRHEMLNETNREEVYQDLLEWMRAVFNRN
jgi:alpha-beta hydrolase superfamily lysophospholipase